jgi:hypothetical protein
MLARSDNLGRLLTEIDALAAAPPSDLLGDWPSVLHVKLREALPEDHLLNASVKGDLTAIIEQARRRLEAALAGHA